MAAPTIPAANSQAVQTTGGGTTPFTPTWYTFFTSLVAFVSGIPIVTTGSFTLSAAASTVVAQAAVTAGSKIVLTPTNVVAAQLVASTRSPYISAISAGVSFTVTTASGVAAAGTETFNYVLS